MTPGATFARRRGPRRKGSTLYPWAALTRGEFFIVPGRLDRQQTANLLTSARFQGLRIRLRRFRHSVRVEGA